MNVRVLAPILVLSLGCATDESSDAEQFIALQRDFDGFGAWDIVWTGADVDGLAHAAGNRTVRVNVDPADLVTPVPVGTGVIKTVEDPNAPPRERRLQELIMFAIDEGFFALRQRLGIALESQA